jgi:hypothetical protein
VSGLTSRVASRADTKILITQRQKRLFSRIKIFSNSLLIWEKTKLGKYSSLKGYKMA